MSEWTDVWLGIIAVSTLLMAVLQVGAIVYGALLARRIHGTVRNVERQIEPLMAKVNVIGADAARVSALAVQQAERADQVFSQAARRVDQTLAVVQNAVVAPAREAVALASAFRAAISALRAGPRRPKAREEDDPLFIG